MDFVLPEKVLLPMRLHLEASLGSLHFFYVQCGVNAVFCWQNKLYVAELVETAAHFPA